MRRNGSTPAGPADGVVVTGLGVLSCVGSGPASLWRGMAAASSQPAPAADPHAHMEHPLMYSVPEADVPPHAGSLAGTPLGRTSAFALEAARQAVADADVGDVPSSRLAVVVGTGMGDSGLHEQWRVDGPPPNGRWSPAFSVASAVGATIGAEGANVSLSNACAASAFALSVGADLVAAGEADVVVAGGAEAYSRVALACFNRLGAIDPDRCRPFDRRRRGTVFGEGAGFLVLESERHAEARGAPRVYARVAGAGWSCDAYHMTAPEPSGERIARTMRHALDEAGAEPEEVGCVVPHGTGTALNDVVESVALREVLGARWRDVPLYSLKALLGHTGGAAGALAAVAATLIVDREVLPPNVPLDEPDPDCDVWLPQVAPLSLSAPLALVNAYAFGGNNVSLVLQGVG
jgi:3-oxoacyl-(acyl-carrier-protein) synthase